MELSIEQWASYLRVALGNSETLEVSQEASKCLGRLARIYDKVLPRETLDTELREALEWLSPKQPLVPKRLTAVFVLAELFANVPSAVGYEHVDSFITLMEMPLTSPDLNLRSATVEVARCAMKLIKLRSPETRHQYYLKNLAVVENVLYDKYAPSESIHGALLLLNVLLTETGTYMADKLPTLSETLLQLRNAKSHFIRTALIELIPRMAKFHPDKFASQELDLWTSYLIAFTHPKKTERASAFESLANLAKLMESRMKPQVDKIMPVLNETFTAHAKSKTTSNLLCSEVFDCLAAMAQAVGPDIEPFLQHILPVILSTEFTQKLIDTLATTARYIPTVRQHIQDNLLNTLSLILAKEPLLHVAVSANGSTSASTVTTSYYSTQTPRDSSGSAPVSPRTPGSSGSLHPLGLAASQYSPRPKETPFTWMKTWIPPTKPMTSVPAANGTTFGSMDSTSDWEAEIYSHFSSPANSAPSSAPPSGPSSLTQPLDIRTFNLSHTSGSVPGSGSSGPPSILISREVCETSNSRLILALDTLASFDFDPEITKHLIHRVVVNYLDHENVVIRKRSVIACTSLLLQQGELHLLRGYSAQMTSYVLHRLLSTALTDSSTEIRLSVLMHLDHRFDIFLVYPDLLKQLFLFLYDPTFEIRERAIYIAGRLADRNPGYIFPTARTCMLELLHHVGEHEDPLQQEMAARLLGITFKQFPALLSPYVAPLCQQLLSVAKSSPKAEVVAHTLSALGDLAEVTAHEMEPFLDELLPIVIDAFQDLRVTLKREQALKALSQIILGTSCVSTGLLDKHPKLFDVILNKIKREDPGQGRIELVRLLGIIGALDPYKHKELQLAILEAEDKVGVHQPGDVLMKNVTYHSSQYFPAVALTALLKLVRNPYGQHAPFQSLFVQAITAIFQSMGVKCVSYLKHFIPLFARLMAASADQFGFREQVFQQLCLIVSLIKHFTRDYLNDFMSVVNDYWEIPKLFNSICSLLEEIATVLGDEFRPSLDNVVPKMILILKKDAISNYSRTIRVLHAFDSFGELLDAHVPRVLPIVLGLICPDPLLTAHYAPASSALAHSVLGRSVGLQTAPVPPDVQVAAISYLSQMLARHDVAKYALTILHPLLRALEAHTPATSEPLMEAIANLAALLHQEFKVFMPQIHAITARNGIRSARYVTVCHAILRGDTPTTRLAPPRTTGNATSATVAPKPVQAARPTVMASRTVAHNTNAGVGYTTSAVNSLTSSSSYGSDSTVSTLTSEMGASATSSMHPSMARTQSASRARSGSPMLDYSALSQAWDTSRCTTKADWAEWTRKLSFVLLAESPSQALRSCAAAAKAHSPLARELFNAAFISCWSELTYELQMDLTGALEIALSSSTIPPEILQILLDLAEYMEHNEKPLPIDIKVLASLAMKCRAYAKALYYKETEYRRGVTTALVEDIISINYQLQLHEAAQGMLKEAQRTQGVTIKLAWYEKLQKWSTALEAYEKAQLENPKDIEITLGRMRCMHDLGKWDSLSELCLQTWATEKTGPKKVEIATLALSANLNLYRWDMMDTYVETLSTQSLDGCFYQALLCVHKNKVAQAKSFINEARNVAAAELTALMGESYSRAYSVVVRIQQLAELEEISEYMNLNPKNEDDRERRQHTLDIWKKRIQGVDRNVEVWQALLSVRSLVEPPANNLRWWTKFGNLVRKSDRPNKARQILSYLLLGHNRELEKNEPIPDTFPRVKMSYLTLLHSGSATKSFAYTQMEQWVASFDTPGCRVSPEDQARCYAKLARWQMAKFGGDVSDKQVHEIQQTSRHAIEKSPDWYKAWHVWALVNTRFVALYEHGANQAKLDSFLIPAITGFVKSIHLAPYDNLQDILQLLTLWFRHGKKKEVDRAMSECFEAVAIDKWLAVIPQLMARIQIPLRNVRQGIHRMLSTIGKHHPQALVFPIIVDKQSPFTTRATAAQTVITAIRPFCATLLDEALLVSSELIRVAILWKERWYKSLDEASRQYYIEKNTDAMTITLQKLNDMLERGAETVSEQTFVRVFGKDLQKAWEATTEFLKTKKVGAINTAWDLYGHVFRTIKRQLSQDFEKLHLKNVSPRLLAVDSLALSVPGTYAAKKPVVHIKCFNPIIKVISSKQQPRKITIIGSDNLDYGFLLKAHEDLRQDERVMQLFGLVNTFLSLDTVTSKSHLSIRRFSVVPLSTNTGLIEWVPHCDTIHELIKQYRKAHNIPIDAEQIIITRMVPKPDVHAYYKLSPLQKLEVFQAALDGTSPFDLERAFYLNAKGSEDWLERRTTYTRSLAVISMVGYILGLGDRHPNNFLISRNNGKILHIDFGDCFEVAMQREKYAERVPFRLTRMLVAAMEVSGTQGTFRSTCQSVMRVLRANSDSIIAVLEAFVYDPLLNWRLISTQTDGRDGDSVSTFDPNPGMIGIGALPTRDPLLPLDDYEPKAQDDALTQQLALPLPSEPLGIETEVGDRHEALNAKAISVIRRVSDKLSGNDFSGRGTLDESSQVDLLFDQATSTENLASAFLGFCGYW